MAKPLHDKAILRHPRLQVTREPMPPAPGAPSLSGGLLPASATRDALAPSASVDSESLNGGEFMEDQLNLQVEELEPLVAPDMVDLGYGIAIGAGAAAVVGCVCLLIT